MFANFIPIEYNSDLPFLKVAIDKHLKMVYYTCMSLITSYENLPIDLSGSTSKNRHRNEMLWGLTQIFDLYKSGKDFAVIFDNKCDIEIASGNLISFYQVKTGDKNYTIDKLVKVPPKKRNSILSTLYSLYNDATKSLYVVSNCSLSLNNSKVVRQELISFNDLSSDEKEKIKAHIKKQLSVDIDLGKVYFLRSEFCIANPNTLLLGYTVMFLEAVSKNLTARAKSFFDYMQSLVLEKACYENTCKSLTDAIKYKGITKNQVQNILNNFQISNDSRQEKVYAYFDRLYTTVLSKIKVKQAYTRLRKISNQTILKQAIQQILDYIDKNMETLNNSESEAVQLLSKSVELDDCFDDFDRECLVIMALVELEDMPHEDNDSK